MAKQWFERNKRFWSPIHYDKATQAFARDVFPIMGRLPVADITPAIVAQVITKILERDVAETAKKIAQHVTASFGSPKHSAFARIIPRHRRASSSHESAP